MTPEERDTWAKGLTDEQLTAALYEMRDRGAAAASYDADEFATMFDGDDDAVGCDWETFMEEHRDTLEEVMCDAARDYALRHMDEYRASFLAKRAAEAQGWSYHVARMTGQPSFSHPDHGTWIFEGGWQELCEEFNIDPYGED